VTAVGLAASLAPFLVAGSLALISLVLFHYYKKVKREKIPSKAQKVSNLMMAFVYRLFGCTRRLFSKIKSKSEFEVWYSAWRMS
jgi:F0F1-type ATP synthase membrane subunit a